MPNVERSVPDLLSRLSGIVHGNQQISLFEDTAENISLYQSIDHIKHKYGVEKVIRANTIEVNKRVRMAMNMFGAKGNAPVPKSPKGALCEMVAADPFGEDGGVE